MKVLGSFDLSNVVSNYDVKFLWHGLHKFVQNHMNHFTSNPSRVSSERVLYIAYIAIAF